jgi:hypothetical protein
VDSPPFVSGLRLSRALYEDTVRPTLASDFPTLAYAAALIGPGSETLGYDTEQSTDHDWGPRLQLFLDDDDAAALAPDILAAVRAALPESVMGYAPNMAHAHASENNDYECVTVQSAGAYFASILGVDPRSALRVTDWLTFSEQNLRALTAGEVFHDGVGELTRLRGTSAYYPRDIWLYILAAQWRRIAQEEAFPGRCSQVGDELGSRLVTGRLVRDIMRLCFLMERAYAPYIKWLGTAFGELACAAEMRPLLDSALAADTYAAREGALCAAYEVAARMHNDLGVTDPMPEAATPYHGRPFLVISGDRFADALRAAIADPDVLALPDHLGAVDQFADSTDALSMARAFMGAYDPADV